MKLFRAILPLLTILPVTAFADTIVLKDATTIEAYNVEEAGRWVLYTTEASEEAPVQRIAIDKVFAIKTADGELRTVAAAPAPKEEAPKAVETTAGNGPQYITATPAADNAARIAAYNAPTLALKKPKGEKDKEKYCTDFISLWGITSNSILSDENITVDLVMAPKPEKTGGPAQYKTRVTNKTDKNIYIDLANTFKVRADGSAVPYYTNTSYTEGNSGSKGGSLNLGAVAGAFGFGGFVGNVASGVNIGGGNTKSASVTTTEERILMLPPHTSVFLPADKYSNGSEIREHDEFLYYQTIPASGVTSRGAGGMAMAIIGTVGGDDYKHAVEENGIDDANVTRDVMKAPFGWLREFDENNTLKTVRRIITYSTSPTFDTYTAVNLGLYLRGVMGGNGGNVPTVYDPKKLDTSDESHLLVGLGKVKK